jgi:hypothetical protein
MGLQCGRYDTRELNSYWVNEAIAERRRRANPSEIDDRLAWSAKGSTGDIVRPPNHVRFVPILLKKSFPADERNFSGPLMRFARRDVRDHNAFHKNDDGSSCRL